MSGKAKPPAKAQPPEPNGLVPRGAKPTLKFILREGENAGDAMARVILDPMTRHAFNIGQFSAGVLGEENRPDLTETRVHLREKVDTLAAGDLKLASQTLAVQALSLDAMFTEMARRASLNMGEFPDAAERYLRLALKAQSNSRSTLEALAKIHAPREQIVKHVQVHEGGQAVVADHFHAHRGEENGNTNGQPHAARTTGERPALPRQDPLRDGVPSSSGKGEPAVQNARRQRKRRAKG